MKPRSPRYTHRITPLAIAISMVFVGQALADSGTDNVNIDSNTLEYTNPPDDSYGQFPVGTSSPFGSSATHIIAPLNGSESFHDAQSSNYSTNLENWTPAQNSDIVGGANMVVSESSTGNTVTISTTGSHTTTNNGVVAGGLVQGSGDDYEVSGNTVNITANGGSITLTPGGTAGAAVIGGMFVIPPPGSSTFIIPDWLPPADLFTREAGPGTGTVSNNHVNITGNGGVVTIGGNVRGGYSTHGDVKANTVTISGDVTVNGGATGGYADDGNTNDNSVIIDASSVNDSIFGGSAHGSTGAVTASGNTVSISGNSQVQNVFGSAAETIDGTATASDNTITISGTSTAQEVSGGYAYASGTGTGYATGNTLDISGNSDVNIVYGGHVEGNGNASGNEINISGGTVHGLVLGGYVEGDGDAINNTITISGTANLESASLIGGSSGNGTPSTGNTLTFKDWTGTVDSISSFEVINFYLPATFAASDTALTVTGTVNVEDSTINVGFAGNTSALNKGDEFKLIEAGTLQYNAGTKIQGIQGATLDYDFSSLELSDSSIKTRVTNVSINPQTKALSEGFLGGVAFARQGADLVADQGITQARASAQRDSSTSLQGFAAFSYGDARYKTGSHVDVDGYSLLAGLSGRQNGLTVGAFLETGDGSYDSYNSFANRASVKGNGDTKYYGGGLLGRFDFANSLYIEASARVGRLKNEFSGNLANVRTKYDTRSLYTSLHAGLGYVLKLSEKSNLDVYSKYLWTQVGDDKVRLSTGDPVKFDSVNSQRLRAGARFTSALSNAASFYVGAAYEHEFDGKADATAYGHKIKSPDLKGGTGIGEIGFTLRPSGNQNFSVDIGLQGYGGKREGATGSVQVKYQF